MIPPQFDYHAPGTLDEALGLLGSLDDPKVMSGGQSLLPMLKLRLASPANIVDIGRIPGLDTLAEEDGFLRIGALVTETQLEQSAVVAERYPILLDTAKVIADPLVRNRATICGNIAHGDPANDHPATMLALGAQVVATGPDGARTIDVGEFFFGLFMTALGEDEILTEIRIPAPAPNSGGAYVKLERKVGDYAVAGSAVQLSLADDGTVASAGIGLTNLGIAPIRATAAEEALTGQAPPTTPSPPPPRPPPTPPSPSPTGAVPSNTSRTWPACSPPVPSARRSRAQEDKAMATHNINVTVNGAAHAAAVDSRLLLVHLIRDDLALTGTHIGCDTTHCGACTVLMDGVPVKSCTVLAVQADGAEIGTVEGLAGADGMTPLQEGFQEEHGLQCGFCTPGMLMTGTALLESNPNPSEAEIREAISGNLCRCTGYVNIVKAVEYAAAKTGEGD